MSEAFDQAAHQISSPEVESALSAYLLDRSSSHFLYRFRVGRTVVTGLLFSGTVAALVGFSLLARIGLACEFVGGRRHCLPSFGRGRR